MNFLFCSLPMCLCFLLYSFLFPFYISHGGVFSDISCKKCVYISLIFKCLPKKSWYSRINDLSLQQLEIINTLIHAPNTAEKSESVLGSFEGDWLSSCPTKVFYLKETIIVSLGIDFVPQVPCCVNSSLGPSLVLGKSQSFYKIMSPHSHTLF